MIKTSVVRTVAGKCILTLASKKQTDMVLSDDRLLRKTAVMGNREALDIDSRGQSFLLGLKKAADLMDELVKQNLEKWTK
jgi:hypothetical protein